MPEDEAKFEGTLALAPAAGGGSQGGDPPGPKLDSAIRTHIGQGLRAMYANLVREPIPAHWLAHLDPPADPGQRG